MSTVKTYKGHDVPEGATHYAAESKNYCEGFYTKSRQRISISDSSLILGGWTKRDDLIELPQEPETFVPVVGEECEMLIAKWDRVTPLFVGGQLVVVDIASAEIAYNLTEMHFRPIKTEREKVIEWAMSTITIVNEDAIKALNVELGSLYDLGALKIPESEQ